MQAIILAAGMGKRLKELTQNNTKCKMCIRDRVRVFPQSMNVDVALKRKLPRIGGCFECALDGCFGSHDAAMNEPYIDSLGGDGVLYYDDEKVIDCLLYTS